MDISPMPPELAPIIELRLWYESHSTKHKDLARSLCLSPQQLAELFSGRNQPTGSQVLAIIEFLRTNNMTDQPKTLSAAKDRIEVLTAELAELKRLKGVPAAPAKIVAPTPATVVPPTKPRAQAPAFDPASSPGWTPTEVQQDPPPKRLPETANTPMLIQKILDVTVLDPDLLTMLSNPVHTPLQRSMIYTEVKNRRAILGAHI